MGGTEAINGEASNGTAGILPALRPGRPRSRIR
jgi:hypothetical protein